MKRYKKPFKNNMLSQIQALPGNIILRSDFSDFGNPRKVSRTLKAFVEDGVLIKIGYGIYSKTEMNQYLGKPTIKDGFSIASIEALNKLGIAWGLSQATLNYNQGKSTQIPSNLSVRLKSRYRGKITFGRQQLVFEGNKNAR